MRYRNVRITTSCDSLFIRRIETTLEQESLRLIVLHQWDISKTSKVNILTRISIVAISLPMSMHWEAERGTTCSYRVSLCQSNLIVVTLEKCSMIRFRSMTYREAHGHDRSRFLFLIHCPEYVSIARNNRKGDRRGHTGAEYYFLLSSFYSAATENPS